ncbi:hypothetical protein [Roseibacillus persicicus]|uniref:Uncharacterized protein n=1 Tax=Roseibacillus persicicus TaxID=454148 RepID=A0A918TC63_9BACT|nr:hypothetical protein [Roseibacillus persicicus]MDQ8190717.1 hypothetical protein [Roseibacillus persicicus]GHC40739.1 hypothetical protein GCM10007100_01590 [Roseibacillus persicicus]
METEDTTPNLLKDYGYARSLLKNTSRGKNPDWYRDAHLLSSRLHLFESGENYLAYFWNETAAKWVSVKSIPLSADAEALEEYIQYLRSEVFPGSCRSLGVVLHLNQEASVFDFPQQEWEELHQTSLRELILHDPALVLQDRTLSSETMSFRVYPTPASPQVTTSGSAVATSRRGEELLREFREIGNRSNFPIRTAGISSPLLLLSRLPRTLGPQEKAFCIMLRFEDFSFFGFYSAQGELILLRSIKHTAKQLPHSLESTLATTAASVELADLGLKVFDCRLTPGQPLDEELSALLFNLNYQVFLPPSSEEMALPIELSTFQIEDDNPELAFAETETFGTTIAEGYHLQDFLSASAEELDRMPGAADMKLLRIGRLVTRLGIAACVLFGAFTVATSFMKMSSPDWKQGKKTTSQAAVLSRDLKKVKATERFLADRSKGWVTLELFARLFPLDGTVQFSDAEHVASAESVTSKKVVAAGLVKKWTISGFAMEEATNSLVRLNTQEGMGDVFNVVKETTGNSAFDLSQKTRNLMVNLDLSENPNFSRAAEPSTEQSFPYKFSLQITQRIEAADNLAVPITKL